MGNPWGGGSGPRAYQLHITHANVAAKGAVTSHAWPVVTAPAGARLARAWVKVAAWFDVGAGGAVLCAQIGVGGVYPPANGSVPGGAEIDVSGNVGVVPPQSAFAVASFVAPAFGADGSDVGGQAITIQCTTDGATTLSQYTVGDVTIEIVLDFPAVTIVPP